jgi:hypothetical protein
MGEHWPSSFPEALDKLEAANAKRALARKNHERKDRGKMLDLAAVNYTVEEPGFRADPDERITVIIPSRNLQIDRIERCLQSIRETETPDNVEIIISDFGSTLEILKGLESLSEKYTAKLIASPTRRNWSRSRVLNIGIRNTSYPWVFMTDADMIFHPTLIPMWRRYRREFGDRYNYVAQCMKLPPIPKLPFPWHSDCYETVFAEGRVYDTYGQGGCTILPTKWLLKVRGLNESYEIWGAEDNDLSFRAELDGLELAWMKPGKLLHQWHIKAVSNSVQEKNRDAFMDLKVKPKLITNDESWGTISLEEAEEYQRLGPKPYTPSDDFLTAVEREAQILDPKCDREERINLLAGWGVNALNENHVETALETFEDVLSMDPQNTDALLGLATHQLVYHQFRKCLHYVMRIQEIDPNHPHAKRIANYINNLNLDIA